MCNVDGSTYSDLSLRTMSSTDMHQLIFKWPHTEPTVVIVTGTFDKWSSSIHLVKNSTGFEAAIQIPWEQKIKFKFIVDGEWLIHEDLPTEVDPGGFVNNTYSAPAKPINLPALAATPPGEAEKSTPAGANDRGTNGHGVVSQASQLLSDLADTIAARDGTSSALAYVASGLGAVMHSAVGIDPINIPKIAIPTPNYNDNFILPPGIDTISPKIMEESLPELLSSPIAPLVPILIVPVNAPENNTVTLSPPPESMHILPRPAPEPNISPDTNDVPIVDTVAEKGEAGMHVPVLVNVFPAPEVVIKEIATTNTEVAPAVELDTPEEKVNGPTSDPAVVNPSHISESLVEESTPADAEVTNAIHAIPLGLEVPTDKMVELNPTPVTVTLLAPEPVIEKSTSTEVEVLAEKLPEPLEDEASPIEHKDLDATHALVIDSAETTLLPSKEAIIPPIPRPTSVDEVKPEEYLSPESKEGDSDKISAGDTVVETVVEPIPAIITESTVEVAEYEIKSVAEAKPEAPSASDPTEADPVLEESPTDPVATESVLEQPPIPPFALSTTLASTANAEAEAVSTSCVIPTVAEVSTSSDLTPSSPAVVVEEAVAESEPVEVIPFIDPNLVTEGKEHTTKVPKPGGLAEPETEEVAEPIPTPQTTEDSVPLPAVATIINNSKLEPTKDPKSATNGHSTLRKEMSATGSVKGPQEFPSFQTESPFQTTDNSPSSSKFNSARKKRTSIFGKIKNIFHHDKEKEKK